MKWASCCCASCAWPTQAQMGTENWLAIWQLCSALLGRFDFDELRSTGTIIGSLLQAS